MPSERALRTTPFTAMEVLERANELDDVVHMEVGEPDFEPPAAAVDAAVAALRSGGNGYTPSRGIPALREAIVDYYDRSYGVDVDHEQIVVTPGSSPALLLAMLATVDPGDDVVLTDPYYACYPNFVRQAGGRVRTVGLSPADGFRPRIPAFEAALDAETAAMLVNFPSNPTGAMVSGDELAELVGLADRTDTTVISDEVYHGLSYGVEEHTVLEYTDDAIVVDGLSKRFGMTGWRLGWLVVPQELSELVYRMAQNTVICAPSFVQEAAVAAFAAPDDWRDDVRATYRARRDQLLDVVTDLGLDVGYTPRGAYYLLVDVGHLPGDAFDVSSVFLEEAGVATTPGPDFGSNAADYLRLSYATSEENVAEAGRRLGALLDDAAPELAADD